MYGIGELRLSVTSLDVTPGESLTLSVDNLGQATIECIFTIRALAGDSLAIGE